MALEDAFPVLKSAFGVVERPGAGAVEETNGVDPFRDGVPVGAGIAINSRANRTGDAGHGFEAAQAEVNAEIDQGLEGGAAFGINGDALRVDFMIDKLEDHSAEAFVGHDEIGASADHDRVETAGFGELQSLREPFGIAGFDEEIGRSADAETRVAGERRIPQHGKARKSVQSFENLGFNGLPGERHWSHYRDMASKSTFKGFPPEGMEFLRDLKENNDREWFTPRKAVYQEKVQEPMVELVSAVHAEMLRFAPAYVGEPKKCVFRIYRDTRFAKDKTPYKTHVAAAMWRGGADKNTGAGYYFSISPEALEIGGGLYSPEPDALLAVRRHIADHAVDFRKTFETAAVRKLMGDLHGESSSRAPKGFDPEHPAMDLLKRKHYVLMKSADPALATTPKLLPEIVKRFEAMAPFVDFLNQPLADRAKQPLL